jgi:hypothetical protein
MPRSKIFPPLRFDCIEVFGRPIPSVESINLIWDKLKNDSDKIQFAKTNNIIVEYIEKGDPENLDDIAIRELITKLKQNYQKQHELLKRDDFKIFWQSLAVVNWFSALVAKKKEGNTQALRKNESKLEKYFKNGKIPQTIVPPRYTNLKRFPEYAEAIEHLTKWYDNILILWNKNLRLHELMISEFQIRTEIIESLEKSNNPYFNACQFCKVIFLTDKGGGDKTTFLKGKTIVLKDKGGERTKCGSVECERRYSAGTSRNSNSSPARAKKVKLQKSNNGKPMLCDGCGKKRVCSPLADKNLCKPCCQTA